MNTLPPEYYTILSVFAPYFTKRIWSHVQVMVIGAVLAPGKRTVTSVLRIMGLSREKHFQNYHRILNRASWSSLEISRVLLSLLLQTFVPKGPIVMGLDDTIERRRGAQIKAKGIYRDPVRSSQSHFVKASGLRWLSLMLLAPIPWAKRVWALPFLTVLSPSERYYQKLGRAPKKLTEWGAWMVLQVRHWLPDRRLVVVADASFAVIELLWRLSQQANPICMITRFRLDAALYEPGPKSKTGKAGRPRKKGKRLPTLEAVAKDTKTHWKSVTIPKWYGQGCKEVEIVSNTAVWYHNGMPALPIRWVLIRDPKGKFKTQALLCTDLHIKPEQILKWFILRWQLEVTFQEVRTHLGVETQRQWSDWAILRTTPALFGLFSIVTLLAHQLRVHGKLPIRKAAWYPKPKPTFADALALVRHNWWRCQVFHLSISEDDIHKSSRFIHNCLTEAICYSY
jgi:DDE superfamily endonuclease